MPKTSKNAKKKNERWMNEVKKTRTAAERDGRSATCTYSESEVDPSSLFLSRRSLKKKKIKTGFRVSKRKKQLTIQCMVHAEAKKCQIIVTEGKAEGRRRR